MRKIWINYKKKITKDVINIIKKYKVDYNHNYTVLILEETIPKLADDLTIYIQAQKLITPNIITYELEEYEKDNHMEVEVIFNISNPDFKKLHSFRLPLNIVLKNHKTFELKQVREYSIFEILKDTDHEDEIKYFITQFTNNIADITKKSYSTSFNPTDIFSDEFFYFQNLKSEHEKEIYAKAVGYTTATEAVFEPIRDVINIHGLEVFNSCFDRINFIK